MSSHAWAAADGRIDVVASELGHAGRAGVKSARVSKFVSGEVWRDDKVVGTEIFIRCAVTAPATLLWIKVRREREVVEREWRTRK